MKTRRQKGCGKGRKTKTLHNCNHHSYKNNTKKKIVIMFLQMLNTIKLYHWKTYFYAQHKATDELYSKLNTNIDTFVEIMLGEMGGRVNLTKQKTISLFDYNNVIDFTKEINKYKQFLIDLDKNKCTNSIVLLNIRDEILSDLNKFTYLLTFL